ncbi:hypothetical protein [Pseudalkalibacillus berkeleyi]|uniref:Uncharacterized protein n=1 Tax=Pseudalkalibacillus berkeleyi TaxID=1069813 RepID=A0ABS9H257_9BACL|nr:hypothetical protein [Pseudalkalibacillus berkeleyi]MCF6137915.1 hypothetical protein [Pseudalkalibacillus berkeleyi]
MEFTIITLLIAGIALIVLSFFKQNKTQQIETQLENVSIQLMKELYQINKKIKVLEEEMMITDRKEIR